MGVVHCKYQLSKVSILGNNQNQTFCHKQHWNVLYVPSHKAIELWPPLDGHLNFEIMKYKYCVYVFHFYTKNKLFFTHLLIHHVICNLEKIENYHLRQLENFNFCDCWVFSNDFEIKMFLFPHCYCGVGLHIHVAN